MGRPKLTPWFRGDEKPERPGVYQRRYGDGDTDYSLWDGWHWMCSMATPAEAAAVRAKSVCNGKAALPWRGHAQEPKR